MPTILICSSSIHEARRLAAMHDGMEWDYLAHHDKLAGTRGRVVWLWGDYIEHPLWSHIQQALVINRARVLRVMDW